MNHFRLVSAAALMLLVATFAGCASRGENRAAAETLTPMIAVRLATVAAVQGDPGRAQKVVAECDRLVAQIDAGESVALDVLVSALNSRIAEAGLRPAERAVLAELVSVASLAVQADSVLPEDVRDRLRTVLGWVRAAAAGQALAAAPA